MEENIPTLLPMGSTLYSRIKLIVSRESTGGVSTAVISLRMIYMLRGNYMDTSVIDLVNATAEDKGNNSPARPA